MKASPNSIKIELAGLLDYLLASAIAIYTRPVTTDGVYVSWPTSWDAAPFLLRRGIPSAEDYRHWVAQSYYNAILFDGSLLQVTYKVEGDSIVMHRLCYVPFPFNADLGLLKTEPILDVLDLYCETSMRDAALRTSIRFDFDLEAVQYNHPAAHLTINSPDCRIGCVGPICLGHFVDFVFRNFYPNLLAVHPFLTQLPRRALGVPTLTTDQASRIHVFWRHDEPTTERLRFRRR